MCSGSKHLRTHPKCSVEMRHHRWRHNRAMFGVRSSHACQCLAQREGTVLTIQAYYDSPILRAHSPSVLKRVWRTVHRQLHISLLSVLVSVVPVSDPHDNNVSRFCTCPHLRSCQQSQSWDNSRLICPMAHQVRSVSHAVHTCTLNIAQHIFLLFIFLFFSFL